MLARGALQREVVVRPGGMRTVPAIVVTLVLGLLLLSGVVMAEGLSRCTKLGSYMLLASVIATLLLAREAPRMARLIRGVMVEHHLSKVGFHDLDMRLPGGSDPYHPSHGAVYRAIDKTNAERTVLVEVSWFGEEMVLTVYERKEEE